MCHNYTCRAVIALHKGYTVVAVRYISNVLVWHYVNQPCSSLVSNFNSWKGIILNNNKKEILHCKNSDPGNNEQIKEHKN